MNASLPNPPGGDFMGQLLLYHRCVVVRAFTEVNSYRWNQDQAAQSTSMLLRSALNMLILGSSICPRRDGCSHCGHAQNSARSHGQAT